MNTKLIEHLSSFITERRVQLFDTVLNLRTRYMTIVLEDIYQAHNASAVLRSCECFGIQDVHFIENQNQYRISPDVALGAHKWLNITRYNKDMQNTAAAIEILKKNGYRIVATTPHNNDCNIQDFDLQKGKFALIFGAELNGLTPVALDLADEFVKIPMVGFTESLNISVTAALCIHLLADKIRNNHLIKWQLREEEMQCIKLNWLRTSIKKSDLIEKAFIKQLNRRNKEN